METFKNIFMSTEKKSEKEGEKESEKEGEKEGKGDGALKPSQLKDKATQDYDEMMLSKEDFEPSNTGIPNGLTSEQPQQQSGANDHDIPDGLTVELAAGTNEEVKQLNEGSVDTLDKHIGDATKQGGGDACHEVKPSVAGMPNELMVDLAAGTNENGCGDAAEPLFTKADATTIDMSKEEENEKVGEACIEVEASQFGIPTISTIDEAKNGCLNTVDDHVFRKPLSIDAASRNMDIANGWNMNLAAGTKQLASQAMKNRFGNWSEFKPRRFDLPSSTFATAGRYNQQQQQRINGPSSTIAMNTDATVGRYNQQQRRIDGPSSTIAMNTDATVGRYNQQQRRIDGPSSTVAMNRDATVGRYNQQQRRIDGPSSTVAMNRDATVGRYNQQQRRIDGASSTVAMNRDATAGRFSQQQRRIDGASSTIATPYGMMVDVAAGSNEQPKQFKDACVDATNRKRDMLTDGIGVHGTMPLSAAYARPFYPTFVPYAQPALPNYTFEVKHPLPNTWTMWLWQKDDTKLWHDMFTEIASFDMVEDFFILFNLVKQPSEIPTFHDLLVFKLGIRPMWEDETNFNGGRWTVLVIKNRKNMINTLWYNLLLCLIGDSFGYADQICGVVVNMRTKVDKVSLWTKTAEHSEMLFRIGYEFKKLLDPLGLTSPVNFYSNEDSILKHKPVPKYTI